MSEPTTSKCHLTTAHVGQQRPSVFADTFGEKLKMSLSPLPWGLVCFSPLCSNIIIVISQGFIKIYKTQAVCAL